MLLDGATEQRKEIEAQEEQSIRVIVMEELVVASTKWEERLSQEVPIAVTPYAETQLEYAGVSGHPRTHGHLAELFSV